MTNSTKILIVDDRPENILALRELLAGHDVELISAQCGEEALGLILDHDFGLAILDVQMPGMSGFDLAKLMRGTVLSRHIPIIFVTASRAEKQRIFEGYEKGAVDFLLKPLIPHIVRSKVRIFVELDQARKRMKEQLAEVEQLKTTAEEASRTKSHFLANMSHEIRTPLGSIIGFAELLRNQNLTISDREEYIETIIRNGKHLTNLINDILDFSKIEAGRLEIEQIAVTLSEMIHDLQLTFEESAKQKNTILRFSSSPAVPTHIYTDPVRLRQILTNLIGNAIKFTNNGQVSIYLDTFLSADKRTYLKCEVEDTGCGLAPEAVHHIFSPFAQGDSSTNRKFGGTGLGLSISQSLTKAMGGKLWLERTELGKGSKFVFQVQVTPILHAQEDSALSSSPSHHQRANLRGIEIIAVDDIQDNLTLVQKLLEREEAKVTCLTSGPLVLENLQERINQGDDLSSIVILLDIQMPEMDGYTTARKIRSLGFTGPLIALTAHAMKEERQRCLEAGCDDHICKPINLPSLLKAIHQALKPDTVNQTEDHITTSSVTSVKKTTNSETILTSEKIAVASHTDEQLEFNVQNDMPTEMKALINNYIVHTLPHRLNDMLHAVDTSDYATVARIGHELKGSVAVYQNPHIGKLAGMIEKQAKNSPDVSLIKQTILELQHVSLP